MANVIGNLRAILSLNTKSFVAGLTTAGRATKAFRGSMFNMGRGIQRMGGFLAGFVAPGAAIWTAINQFRELGDLADLSERLNIDPKALQGFRLAAMDAGLAAEETTNALQFMLKTVGEAATGSKEAIKAVSGLGLSIKDLSASSSEEVLYRIADALQRIPLASVRAAKEVDLFGRSGAKLDAALKGGRGSLKGFEGAMADMNRSFSKEQLDKVDVATDKFNHLKESFKGLADVLIVESAPALSTFFDGLKDGFSAIGSIIKGEGIAPPHEEFNVDPRADREKRKDAERERFRARFPGSQLPPNLAIPMEASDEDTERNNRIKNMRSYGYEPPKPKLNRIDRLRHLKRQGFKLAPDEQQELKDAGGPVSMGGASSGGALDILKDMRDYLKVIKERGGMVA